MPEVSQLLYGDLGALYGNTRTGLLQLYGNLEGVGPAAVGRHIFTPVGSL